MIPSYRKYSDKQLERRTKQSLITIIRFREMLLDDHKGTCDILNRGWDYIQEKLDQLTKENEELKKKLSDK